jgi:hypothetical protein
MLNSINKGSTFTGARYNILWLQHIHSLSTLTPHQAMLQPLQDNHPLAALNNQSLGSSLATVDSTSR